MLVVALASLVVVAKHAFIADHIGKPVLVAMGAADQWLRNLLHDNVGNRRAVVLDSLVVEELSLHVVLFTTFFLCCQRDNKRKAV